jgi:p-hydroxybenzoate 3-monooxygenase
VENTAIHDIATAAPCVTFTHAGEAHELHCDVVAACDGFHGVGRAAMPDSVLRVFERVYPFAWLGSSPMQSRSRMS